MATRKSLADALGEDEEQQPQQPTSKKSTRKTDSEPAEEEQAKPARGSRNRQRRNSTTSQQASAKTENSKPQVLMPSTEDAKRAGLYLHNDDYRALGVAKLDDGCDLNARVRAMIALWRANPRYRNQVDRLARTAPRGPHAGSKQ